MTKEVYETLGRLMIDAGEEILAGNCVMDEEQALYAISTFAHKEVTKDVASAIVGTHPSNFDKKIKANKFPKGRKKRGEQLKWYIDELTSDITQLPKLLRKYIYRK